MEAPELPSRTELEEVGRSPQSRLRQKRPLSRILPSASSSTGTTPRKAHHHQTHEENGERTGVVSHASAEQPAAEAAAQTAVAAAAAASSSSSSSTPWDLSLSEGLDFCRDAAALLRQLLQRIESTGQQLATAAALPSTNASSAVKGDEARDASGGSEEGKGESKLIEHQHLLKDEIDDCLLQIQ